MPERAKARILLIDDEEDLVRGIKSGLEHHGFLVDAYSDPLEALRNFTPGFYDLAMLDVRMPQVHGFEVFKELKKADSAIIICFLSALDDANVEFSERFPGVDLPAFLIKPLSLAHLAKEVEKLVKEGRGEDYGHPGAGFNRALKRGIQMPSFERNRAIFPRT